MKPRAYFRIVATVVTLDVRGSSGSLNLQSSGYGDLHLWGLIVDAIVSIIGDGNVFIGGSSDTVISGIKTRNGSCYFTGSFSAVDYKEYTPDGCEKKNITPATVLLPTPDGDISVGPGTCSFRRGVSGYSGTQADNFIAGMVAALLAWLLLS